MTESQHTDSTGAPSRVPPTGARAPLLEIDRVSIHFGGIIALQEVSFAVPHNKVVGLIGPNGAGKTTLFNCLSRLYTPTSGDILFEGRSILGLQPYRMAELGIGRTFQNLALFSRMSVLDNIRVGIHNKTRSDHLSNALRLPWTRREEAHTLAKAKALIEFLDLGDVMNQPATGLPFGTLKRVELARALAAEPKLLLLDEPAGGLNHGEVEELIGLIRTIRDQRGITVLLVEHHMSLVMKISDEVVVLDFGRMIAEGTPETVQKNPEVIRAYLGGGEA